MHAAVEISLFAKAAFAVVEIVGGLAAYLVPQAVLLRLVERIAREELLDDRRDLIADYLLQWAQGFSISTRHFTAAYLLLHGLVKLWLIIGLLRGKTWYYPIALAVFGAFIVYQLYRFHFTHSIWLIAITVVDVVVIALTAYEYRHLPQRGNATRQLRR
jgi:uncharacterized membrane protein